MSEFKEPPADAPLLSKALQWIDNRFPASKLYKEHLGEYYAPKNFNIWYVFGALAMFVLAIQIVTGIFLTMHYKPSAELAFASVEYIMRDVPWGWLIRYMHSTGASAFFIVVYLHMFRGLIYGSYRNPRELVWIFGCMIFLCLMAEAFMGYLLPWGQMSYWGAQVIVNLFAAIPFVGPDLAILIRGDYVVGDATLNRFFAFHVIAVPLVLLGLVVAHIIALHEVGSNNPDGIEIKGPDAPKDANGHPLDGVPFHPYYTVHDIFAVSVFLMAFTAVVFLAPEFGGYFLEYNNFIPADPFKTPQHIAPVWYFTPFYSMLRAVTGEMIYAMAASILLGAGVVIAKVKMRKLYKAVVGLSALAVAMAMFLIDAKFWGVVVMGGSVMILFALPWLDHSPVKSIRYRPTWHQYIYGAFIFMFFILGYLGVQAPGVWGIAWGQDIAGRVSQVFTFGYFGFFALMPWWSKLGTFKKVPERITFTPH
jgi:ubiquinol-cytochrome c reductase cytochrome b subunit